MRYSRVLLIAIIFALLTPLISGGQEIGVRAGDIKGPVDITADEIEHDRAANTYTARGNVVVKETTRTVAADYIFLDDNTKDVTAIGHVIYEDLGTVSKPNACSSIWRQKKERSKKPEFLSKREMST
jgi:lipopolysaccharide assembly outer membrane protein LptD (OstA)